MYIQLVNWAMTPNLFHSKVIKAKSLKKEANSDFIKRNIIVHNNEFEKLDYPVDLRNTTQKGVK